MGRVRVAVAPSFAGLHLVPRLGEFFRKYPAVSVEVLASERLLNLVEEGIDVAVRNGEVAESSVVARKIGSSAIVVVASPAYLEEHGEPAKPTDLERHRCIVFSSPTGPRPWLLGGRPYLPDGSFRTNEGEPIRAAALLGIGLAQIPHWLCAREIENGSLRRVLRKYEPDPMPISAIRPASRRVPARVGVFIEFLAETLAALR